MKKRGLLFFFGLLLAGVLVFAAWAAPAPATMSPYYKGKTIKMIGHTSAGGTYDRMARLAAQFMPKYIPGEPTIIVQNILGGQGMIAARTAYNAKPDGLTLVHLPSSMALGPWFGKKMDIDFLKWGYLGSVGGAHFILSIRSELPYRSVEELRSSPEPIKAGVMGRTGTISCTTTVAQRLGKLNLKIVPGYKGFSDVALAVRQGEVDGVATSAASHIAHPLAKEMFEKGFTTIVLSLGGAKPPKKLAPVIDKLPYLRDSISDKVDLAAYDAYMASLKISRLFMAPPSTPSAQLKIIRDAFSKMQHNQEFITAAEKQGFVLYPVGHEETVSLIKSMLEIPKPVEDRLKEVFK